MQFLKPDGTLVGGSRAKGKLESAPLCITSQRRIEEYEATIAKLKSTINDLKKTLRGRLGTTGGRIAKISARPAKKAPLKSESGYWWHPRHGPLRTQFPSATPLTKEEYRHRLRALRQRGRELERWARNSED